MKKHTLVSLVLNISTLGFALIAWAMTVGETISSLEIASLLGVVAFSLMWVHYVADMIAPRTDDEQPKDMQYVVSRYTVLFAILSHPFLVNYYLVMNDFGFPPDSYEALLGDLALVVLLGWMALAAFLLFELRSKLRRFDRKIFHANIVAMFLVLIHGFLIGMVMMDTWYVWVWWTMLLIFAIVIFRRYALYYADHPARRIVAYVGVFLLMITAVGSGVEALSIENQPSQSNNFSVLPDDGSQISNNEQSEITNDQLRMNDGRDGSACWIAVSGKVYEIAGVAEWREGEHTTSDGRAECGEDLTDVIGLSPHGRDVLSGLKVIGNLAEKQ